MHLCSAPCLAPPRLFDTSLGAQQGMDGDVLVLSQERGGRITLNEQGSVCISVPIERSSRMMPEIIYEVVQGQLAGALEYASWVLDLIDPTQRLTHVSIAAGLTGADHMAWRTQRGKPCQSKQHECRYEEQ